MRGYLLRDRSSLNVAYEATALLGPRTGVGEFCHGALSALSRLPELEVGAFAMSFRKRHELVPELPGGVRFYNWIMPARPLHAMWRRSNLPPLELWDRKIDVVHGTNFVVPPTLSAGKVITVHDLTTLLYPELCNPATLIFPKMIQRAIDAGAYVHTPSNFVANEVVGNFNVSPDRVVAIPHGIPVLDADVGIGGVVEDLMGKRFILGLGTVEPRKDFPLLVRAFDEISNDVSDIVLVIAGQDGWGTQDLIDAISDSHAKAKIMRLGYVAPLTRLWLIKNSSVFVYPSVYEGFGFPPLEAMALGTPVISTRAGALSEVLSEESAVLVNPGDKDELASAMKRVVTEMDFAQRLSYLGRLHANGFSWESCAKGLSDLYYRASLK